MKNAALFIIPLIAVGVIVWLALPKRGPVEPRFGDATSALSPGTLADDATVGTVAWSSPSSAAASDNSYASVNLNCGGGAPTENSIKIVKGGSIVGDEKSTTASLTNTDTYITYGGSSDLWGTAWTADDINATTFGVVYSGKQGSISHYLKATNFGFSVPAGATINGITVEIEQAYSNSAPC